MLVYVALYILQEIETRKKRLIGLNWLCDRNAWFGFILNKKGFHCISGRPNFTSTILLYIKLEHKMKWEYMYISFTQRKKTCWSSRMLFIPIHLYCRLPPISQLHKILLLFNVNSGITQSSPFFTERKTKSCSLLTKYTCILLFYTLHEHWTWDKDRGIEWDLQILVPR